MDTEVTVVRRAVEAEINPKGNRSPCWVLLAAVKAYLSEAQESASKRCSSSGGGAYFVGGLILEFLEQFVRLLLSRKATHLEYRRLMQALRGGEAAVRSRQNALKCREGGKKDSIRHLFPRRHSGVGFTLARN
jgi:hypothetical protein